jgi:hypothetical protein
VRETKGADKIEDLQWKTEGWKMLGEAHFAALGRDYDFGEDPASLIEPSPAMGRSSSAASAIARR